MSTFTESLDSLRKSLDILSITLTGETFVAVLRMEGEVSNIALGVYSTQQAVEGIAASLSHSQAVMEGKLDAFGAKKTAQARRDSRTSSMEIDDRNVEWFEDEPFAEGSFGSVYRVKYERKVVAAKKISLHNVPQKALEGVKKEFKKEVALMGEVRTGHRLPPPPFP